MPSAVKIKFLTLYALVKLTGKITQSFVIRSQNNKLAIRNNLAQIHMGIAINLVNKNTQFFADVMKTQTSDLRP